MAAVEPYYFEPNMLENSENGSSEDSEVNNCLEKHILLTMWRMQRQF